MIRKYNIEFDEEKNPFFLSEENIKEERTWDWYFERGAYEVKEESFRHYAPLLDIVVKNRDIISHVFLVSIADIPNMNVKIDLTLVIFFQSVFNRMIKQSKVIQDLSVQGNYIEAKSLLRNNFERAILVEYFTHHTQELREYFIAKKAKNKKVLSKYTINKLTAIVQKDYQNYQYLCQFVHSDMHKEDANFIDIEGNPFVLMKSYNEFDYREFAWINHINNNIFLETFFTIFDYLKSQVPENKLKDEGLKEVFDSIKELMFISLKPNPTNSKNKS